MTKSTKGGVAEEVNERTGHNKGPKGIKQQVFAESERSLLLLLLLASKLLEDGESLLDFGVHRFLGFKQGKKLVIVHLEKHTGDFASKLRLRTERWIRIKNLKKICQLTLQSSCR